MRGSRRPRCSSSIRTPTHSRTSMPRRRRPFRWHTGPETPSAPRAWLRCGWLRSPRRRSHFPSGLLGTRPSSPRRSALEMVSRSECGRCHWGGGTSERVVWRWAPRRAVWRWHEGRSNTWSTRAVSFSGRGWIPGCCSRRSSRERPTPICMSSRAPGRVFGVALEGLQRFPIWGSHVHEAIGQVKMMLSDETAPENLRLAAEAARDCGLLARQDALQRQYGGPTG